MSKVKVYYDYKDKQKSKRRLRRHETAKKKKQRFDVAGYNRYGWYVRKERYYRTYGMKYIPEHEYKKLIGFDENGPMWEVSVIPAKRARVLVRGEWRPVKPYLRRWHIDAKKWRTIANRKFRRSHYFGRKGNWYRRNFDIDWTIF